MLTESIIQKKMTIPKQLNDEIWDYCRANNITAIDDFMVKLLRQGFTVEKYGAAPATPERVVEKIVEVPVEKIVEKEIHITNNEEVAELTQKLNQITEELNQTRIALEEEKKKKKDIYGE